MYAKVIKAVEDLIGKNNRVLKFPTYKKDYNLKKEYCKKLYDNIIKTIDDKELNPFGEQIIYYVEEKNNNLEKIMLLSRHQYIITLYIFLKALLDISKTRVNTIRDEILNSVYNVGNEYNIKLIFSIKDEEMANHLFNDKINEMNENSIFYINYRYFKERIYQTLSEGKNLEDIFKAVKKYEFFEIVLDREDGELYQKKLKRNAKSSNVIKEKCDIKEDDNVNESIVYDKICNIDNEKDFFYFKSDFSRVAGEKPDKFKFKEKIIKVPEGTWQQLIALFFENLYTYNDFTKKKIEEIASENPKGRSYKNYISYDSEKLGERYGEIKNSGIYYQKNMSAPAMCKFIVDLITEGMGFKKSDFKIKLLSKRSKLEND